jgi:hypothetical protein
MIHRQPIHDIEVQAVRDELAEARQVEQALRQQLAAAEQSRRDREVAHVAEVRALHVVIDRLRSRPHHDRDVATQALEPRHD